MTLIVQKFGGTSVKNLERIHEVSCRIRNTVQNGARPVIVVSAMADVTNDLVGLAASAGDLSGLGDLDRHEESEDGFWAEYDAIVSTGEIVAAGLLAVALQKQGLPARSFAGFQIPIRTNNVHGKARIASIETHALKAALEKNIIPVITGFQGVCDHGRLTTLSRGGSDTSAVALAVALGAARCDIYTDVDGIYTADPRIEPKARKMATVTHEEMLEMASLGAKVLHVRCIHLAHHYNMALRVLSSFNYNSGTDVCGEDRCMLEPMNRITAVIHSSDDVKIDVFGIEEPSDQLADCFGGLENEHVFVDMIAMTTDEEGLGYLSFTVPRQEAEKVVRLLEAERQANRFVFKSIRRNPDYGKVSVVGAGMRHHMGVAAKMFATLRDKKIPHSLVATSEIKISVLVPLEYVELATRSLHAAFGLDRPKNGKKAAESEKGESR